MHTISELPACEQFQIAALNLNKIPIPAPDEINIASVTKTDWNREKDTYYGENCRENYGKYYHAVWYQFSN